MARVTGLNDSNTDLIIKEFLLQQEGVLMSRIDHNSESVLVIFDLDQLSEAELVALIESQNMHVTCSLIDESPINIRQKFQSKCYKASSAVSNETQEK
jgi:hypothetical protein